MESHAVASASPGDTAAQLPNGSGEGRRGDQQIDLDGPSAPEAQPCELCLRHGVCVCVCVCQSLSRVRLFVTSWSVHGNL